MTTNRLTKQEIDKIRKLREREGMTFKALGERFGVSRATIMAQLKRIRKRFP